jgi:integrase
MATFKYHTRTQVKSPAKLVPIYIRFKQGGFDVKVRSGFRVRIKHFNNASGELRNKASFTNRDELDKKLRDLKSHILDIFSVYTGTLSKEWLETTINEFNNPTEEVQVTLFSFIQDYIDKAPVRIAPKTGKPVCYKQIREYERTFYYLKGFAASKKVTLDFGDVDLDFYHDFVKYLQELGLAKNTTGKKVQTLKIFLNAANDTGIQVNNAYRSHRFTAISEESESIYLTEVELQTIYALDLSNRIGLDRVRDLFIVGCWTGLRYSDWGKVRSENIDDDGFLELKQEKTGGVVVIPLHQTVLDIMDKYNGVLPPVLTNQKFNETLKLIAEKAGLKETVHKAITRGGIKTSKAYPKYKLVTTHTARRSFATNLYKAGLPAYSIMQITGHRTEVSFLKYIKVTPREHAEKLKQFWHDQVKLKAV